jgi:hypothetical protein
MEARMTFWLGVLVGYLGTCLSLLFAVLVGQWIRTRRWL